MHKESFVLRDQKYLLFQEQCYKDIYNLLGIEGPEQILNVGFGGIRRVLVNRPGEVDFLLANLMLDQNLYALVRHWYLLHDIYNVSLDRYLGMRQVYAVELLQDLLETIHEGIVRKDTYSFLCVHSVYVHSVKVTLCFQGVFHLLRQSLIEY